MNLPAAGQSRRPSAVLRAAMVLAVVVAPCISGVTRAHAQGWYPVFGCTVRPLVGVGPLGDMAAPAWGIDFGLRVSNETGGAGLRAVLGTNQLESDEIYTSGSFFGTNYSGKYTTTQVISWWALGPNWSFPQSGASAEVYALVGTASSKAEGNGVLLGSRGSNPGSASSWVAITGAIYSLRLPKPGYSAELGGEFQMGGRGTFWESPPAGYDGNGNLVRYSRRASMSGFAIRFGLSYRLPSL